MTTEGLLELARRHNHVIVPPPREATIDSCALVMPDGIVAVLVDEERCQTKAEYREKLSHELGHAERHAFYTRLSAPAARLRAEETARRWSWRTMVPPDELFRQMERGLRTPWELAEYFNVPQKMVTEAVTYYRDVLGEQK